MNILAGLSPKNVQFHWSLYTVKERTNIYCNNMFYLMVSGFRINVKQSCLYVVLHNSFSHAVTGRCIYMYAGSYC